MLLVVIVVLAMWLAVGIPPAAGLYGDPILLRGTVALWPPESFGYRLAVVRGDDGNDYFVRFTPATQVPSVVNVGDGVVIVGREMVARDEITAVTVQQESAVAPVAGPSPSASPRDLSAGHESWSVVHGSIVAASGSTWLLTTDRGRTLAVDASAVGNALTSVHDAPRVTVVGRFVSGGLLTAQGVTTEESRATR